MLEMKKEKRKRALKMKNMYLSSLYSPNEDGVVIRPNRDEKEEPFPALSNESERRNGASMSIFGTPYSLVLLMGSKPRL